MTYLRSIEEVRPEFKARERKALLLTTVPVEGHALTVHLNSVEKVTAGNGLLYQVGVFSDPAGDWHVVHVITQPGNTDVASAATRAHADFGSFDVQMFVGIAGSLKSDVPIGSVVVGLQVHNIHAAKVDNEGSYNRAGAYPAAPHFLYAAQMLIQDADWFNFIRSPKNVTLPSEEAYPKPYPPNAFIKDIASGEQVVAGGKSSIYLNIRKDFNNAAAVEMEGYGAMAAAHREGTAAIIIRGISDMCDGKSEATDAERQPVAAAHAAAFAFALLSLRSQASPGSGKSKVPGLVEVDDATPVVSLTPVNYVLNFKGVPADFPTARLDKLISLLREITKDPNVTLVRVEPGSVRVILRVRQKDLPQLTISKLKNAFGPFGEKLLGAALESELGRADDSKARLLSASAHLLAWKRLLPDGRWLDRPEKSEIEARFSTLSSTTVVLGDPGAGKSALLASIAIDLAENGLPVLAIKADSIGVDVSDEHALQVDLGLPELPGTLIENLARIQPVYLLIDQLDALANNLDLRSERLNVLLNLIRRVGDRPNVHVLLSARTFEFSHDVRLRAINAEAIGLSMPAWHEVAASLKDAGVDADGWPERARDVVRNPQALKTYLALAPANASGHFSKYQELLERLWTERVLTTPKDMGVASLAADMAGIMAESEVLWLAASRFDSRATAMALLESTGLVIRSDDRKRVGFSHQTVFEFVLARNFVRQAGGLSTYVLNRQNSLFVRAKLWAALTYMRDVEPVSYERELSEIWMQFSLRRHLRLMVVSFLGQVARPTNAEKTWFDEALKTENLRVPALRATIGNLDWFDTLKDGTIKKAMTGSEIEISLASQILQKAWLASPASVTQLIDECWLPSERFDSTVWWTIGACATWTIEVEKIAQIIVKRGHVSASAIDFVASFLAVEQPEVALKLVRTSLELLSEGAKVSAKVTGSESSGDVESGERNDYMIKRSLTDILEMIDFYGLPDIAHTNPAQFIEILWPWYRQIFSDIIERTPQRVMTFEFAGMYGVDLGIPGDLSQRHSLQHPLIAALTNAVEALAVDHSKLFESWVDANSSCESMPVQRLIAFGFSKGGAALASGAHAWLVDDFRRLRLGSASGRSLTTSELLVSVATHWTDMQLRVFETMIQAYSPRAPDDYDAGLRKFFSEDTRRTKARLLSLLPQSRLGEGSADFVASAAKAFGGHDTEELKSSNGGFIGSPMSAAAMSKARDKDILRIFQEIPDDTNWDHPSASLRGGNIQLSRAFAEFAKANPSRAFRLIGEFLPGKQERAAGYALESIAETDGHDDDVLSTISQLEHRGFSSEGFQHSVSHAIEKLAQRDVVIGEAVVGILAGWIEKWPSDGSSNFNHTVKVDVFDDETDDVRSHSILWGMGGMTILPGGRFPIYSALSSVLLGTNDDGRDRLFALLDAELDFENNAKVWQALLYRLSNAGGSAPLVVSRFIRKLFARHPSLVRTREAAIFLAHAQRWDTELVFDVVEPWNRVGDSWLEQAQGELVGLVATVRGGEPWLQLRDMLAENGSESARVGLGFAGANLWVDRNFHVEAGLLLDRLIPAATKPVMSAILDMFRLSDRLHGDAITIKLLESLAGSGVDLSGAPSSFFIERLQSILPHAQASVGAIARKLVESWRDELGDVRTGTSMAAPELTDLAITLHRLGGDSRETGVTVFEALLDIDAYGTRETLAEIDGRFGVPQTGVRRRVARRAARRTQPE